MSAAEGHAGGCLCGAVRYRLEGAPIRVGVCHCSLCRRNTGAPFAVLAVFDRSQLVHERGEQRHWDTPDYRRHFCPTCGSATYSECLSNTTLDVHVGALDDAAALTPTFELWTQDAATWVPRDPKWVSYQRGRGSGPTERE